MDTLSVIIYTNEMTQSIWNAESLSVPNEIMLEREWSRRTKKIVICIDVLKVCFYKTPISSVQLEILTVNLLHIAH